MIAAICLAGCGNAAPGSARPTASAAAQTPPLVTQASAVAAGPFASGAPDDLKILFINVGRADSALVALNHKYWLIDTGTADSLPALVRALRSAGVQALEGVFLTHTHSDHIGGLDGLLALFTVQNIYASEITVYKKNGDNVVDEKAQAAGMTVRRLARGDEITLGAGAEFTVLGPIARDAVEDNNNSLVLRLQDGPFSCLFAGDMQFPEEDSLLAAGAVPPCTALKVADHGNPDASSAAFITAVSPQIAVISTDSSVDTDTPAPSVLAELQAANAQVFVTQDAKTGILVTVRGGKATAEAYDAGPAPPAKDIRVESFSKKKDLLVLGNGGAEAVDLTHWWIVPETGGEPFYFPDHTVIAPGGTLTVTGGKSMPEGSLLWENKDVWSAKDDAAVSLYDDGGNLVCTAQ